MPIDLKILKDEETLLQTKINDLNAEIRKLKHDLESLKITIEQVARDQLIKELEEADLDEN